MFSSLSRRRLVALLVLTCLLLITLDRNDNAVFSRVRRVFGVAMEPFDTAARVVALPIIRAWNSFTDYDDLERDNERLRDQLEAQRGAETVAVANQLRLNDLLAINRLLALGNHKSLISRVVGDAPGNFQNSVEISVGARDGIAVGMPVTDGAGLVGRISQVKASSSIVLLITDPGYHVSAEVLMAEPPQASTDSADSAGSTPASSDPAPSDPGASLPTDPAPVPEDANGPNCADVAATMPPLSTTTTSTTTTVPTIRVPSETTSTSSAPPPPATTTTTAAPPSVIRETGTLSGQTGQKPLLLEHVDDSSGRTNLCVGALVSTAGGTGSLAPQGIPIGRISRIDRTNQTGSRDPVVEVTPNAKLSQLNFVAVVLFVPNDEAG